MTMLSAAGVSVAPFAAGRRGVGAVGASAVRLRSQISRIPALAAANCQEVAPPPPPPRAPLLMLFTPEEETPHQSTIHLLDLKHADEDHFIQINHHGKLILLHPPPHPADEEQEQEEKGDDGAITTSGGSRLIGCSQGFLITYHEATRTLGATHPLSGAHLRLPPGFTANPLTRAHFRPPYASTCRGYDYSAVLSPSLSTVFLNPAPEIYRLDYCIPVLSDIHRSHWTSYHPVLPFSVDSTFHRGLLHVLLENGSLAVFDLDRPFSSPLRVLPVLPLPLSIPKPWYLVSSSEDDDDLFLVSRTVSESPTSSTATVHADEDAEYDGGYHDSLIARIYCCKESVTTSFEVFRLVPTQNGLHYRWERVADIGDMAMFVGHYTSCCLSLSLAGGEFPHLKANCIYFATWLHQGILFYPNCGRVGDAGVFNLEDGTVRHYQLTEDGCKGIPWQYPSMWYMP